MIAQLPWSGEVLRRQILEFVFLVAGLILKPLQIIIMVHGYTHDLQKNYIPTTCIT
jgi:hypothetical protein